jgi:hypothetical protein
MTEAEFDEFMAVLEQRRRSGLTEDEAEIFWGSLLQYAGRPIQGWLEGLVEEFKLNPDPENPYRLEIQNVVESMKLLDKKVIDYINTL